MVTVVSATAVAALVCALAFGPLPADVMDEIERLLGRSHVAA